MKKNLTAVSLVSNLVLLAAIFWMRAEHQQELGEAAKTTMRGDEKHLLLHVSSLAALESADPEKTAHAVRVLRLLTAAGKKNIELRRQVGIWD